MNSTCRKLQAKLAVGGPESLREDSKGLRHLEECGECFAMLESLAELDLALAELPEIDAPDPLVAQLLARLEPLAQETSTASSPRRSWQRWLASISALVKLDSRILRTASSMAALMLAIGLTYMVWSFAGGSARPGFESMSAPEGRSVQRRLAVVRSESEELKSSAPLDQLDDSENALAELNAEVALAAREAEVAGPMPSLGSIADGLADELAYKDQDNSKLRQKATSQIPSSIEAMGDLGGVSDAKDVRSSEPEAEGIVGGLPKSVGKADLPVWVGSEADISFRDSAPRLESQIKEVLDRPAREKAAQRLAKRLNELPRGLQERREGGRGAERDAGRDAGREAGAFANDRLAGAKKKTERKFSKNKRPMPPREAPPVDRSLALAEIFLEERARLENIGFQPAEGYWANTYIPGDPALRHLQASLLGRDRSVLEAFSPGPLGLHHAVRQTTQPFDLPESAALAVYLHADRAALEGRQRLLLQVGLQASERLGGRRPAMNLGVVLDLRGEIPTSSATTLRALMTAFAQSRDLGDRFRLLVAGRAGGEVVGPGAFRHGPVAVTLGRLLSGEGAQGVTLGLAEALTIAVEAVSRDDDPTSPLGSSAVILITDQPLGAESAALGRTAHQSALQGVTVSVIGVGDRVGLGELESLALAGQGHRRLLHLPGEATAVVERELAAVGRAVARAVRLRIRLAPGVELIDVLGSHRLDVAAAERVRQAEQSIDRRLSRNLGISADRGDDEDGLQIIIPSFYAGDSHVVLLDVVASGPGPIADVRVRYKDLVYFENGVARGRLTLDRGQRPAGPLERNVLKNLLAFDAYGVLEEAGHLLQAGDPEVAREHLLTFRQLLLGLGQVLPDLAKDRDLERDIALLNEYVALLEAGVAKGDEARSHLADSLRFSGHLKVLPRPAASGDS
jgi:hypothetical protein